jgi:hypothetical protein
MALNCNTLPAAAAQQLEVVHWFPDHPTTEFFPGKPVSCVIGVRNAGSSPLNITAATASLNSPYNASMNLYNFTAQVSQRQGGWRPRETCAC